MPLPEKKKREDESEFQHKIRQWTEEVKDRPERFSGGRDQAVAIAAEQSGTAKKSGANMRDFIELIAKAEEPVQRAPEQKQPSRQAAPSAPGQEVHRVGARGGKVVGYTKTGRPIYESKLRDEEEHKKRYTNYEDADHRDAYSALGEAADNARQADDMYRFNKLKEMAMWHHGQVPNESKPRVHDAFVEAKKSMKKACKACKACKGEACAGHKDEEMEKALTSRALVIPRHMQVPAYDPAGSFRSATQVSRMYSDIAPDVRATLNDVAMNEDPRTHRANEEFRRSLEIQELRDRIARSILPRGEVRFDPRHSG